MYGTTCTVQLYGQLVPPIMLFKPKDYLMIRIFKPSEKTVIKNNKPFLR